jgi:hypothetical protein
MDDSDDIAALGGLASAGVRSCRTAASATRRFRDRRRTGPHETKSGGLVHYVVYHDGKQREWAQRARELLDTLELRACEQPTALPEPYEVHPDVCLSVARPEPEPQPAPPKPSPGQQRRAEREQKRAAKVFRPRKRP